MSKKDREWEGSPGVAKWDQPAYWDDLDKKQQHALHQRQIKANQEGKKLDKKLEAVRRRMKI